MEPRDLLCVIPQSIFIYTRYFVAVIIDYIYALVLATPHAFTLRSLAIVSYAVHFFDNNHIINARMSQHACMLVARHGLL